MSDHEGHLYEKEEWFEIGRMFRPDYTRVEFERDWAEFIAMKRWHGKTATILIEGGKTCVETS